MGSWTVATDDGACICPTAARITRLAEIMAPYQVNRSHMLPSGAMLKEGSDNAMGLVYQSGVNYLCTFTGENIQATAGVSNIPISETLFQLYPYPGIYVC